MRSYGSGASLVQPFLDLIKSTKSELLNKEQEVAVRLIKDAFISAAERDIYTGDQVNIVIISKNGIVRDFLRIRND